MDKTVIKKDTASLLRSIIEVKKKTEEKDQLIHFLTAENFEDAVKINRMKNIIGNINNVIKNSPGSLMEISDNLCQVLQTCNEFKPTENIPADKSTPQQPTSSLEKVSKCTSKAHIVNPHMVNGHILYVPTINLTRVSAPCSSQKSLPGESRNGSSSQENSSLFNDETSPASNFAGQPSTSSHGYMEESNQTDTDGEEVTLTPEDNMNILHTEDSTVERPSTSSAKSPSHSTVLSGTFQEVKIYLNQISQEKPNQSVSGRSKSAASSKIVKKSRGCSSSRGSRKSSK